MRQVLKRASSLRFILMTLASVSSNVQTLHSASSKRQWRWMIVAKWRWAVGGSVIALTHIMVCMNYFYMPVGPGLRPQRPARSVADGFQLRRDVRRHSVRFPVGQVRPQEVVRGGAGHTGGRRLRDGVFARLLPVHCTALHRRSTGTGRR